MASAPTANENDEELSISEMAEAFDVTMRTLRFYEEKGLLHPRRLGNRRYYNGFCRSRLTLVLKGKAMGMGLDDIAALVAAVESNENDAVRADQVRMLCDTQLGELKARRAALDEQISETERALSGLVSL
ncbi:MAG: MerR family DNA-binding transcriptional regulator [Devosiaceae bacterium]|nr:MerR family DNA-binding transcriptional regulator [Devosiaceae bacterium MH13]